MKKKGDQEDVKKNNTLHSCLHINGFFFNYFDGHAKQIYEKEKMFADHYLYDLLLKNFRKEVED